MAPLAIIVEDDPDLQLAMGRQLRKLGFDVTTALHYEAAVEALGGGSRPALVCVDLGLPTRSGYDLCAYIRVQMGLTRLPILVTSESGSPREMADAEEAGANAFMMKPFMMDELAACVVALLHRGARESFGAPERATPMQVLP